MGGIAVAVFLLGVSVLIGWALNITFLKSILPGMVMMKANTALGFILCGTSLTLLTLRWTPRWLVFLCSGLVILLGLLTLSEFIFSWDAGIDQLLFLEPPGGPFTPYPGRMSVYTASCFALMGTALLQLSLRRNWQVIQLLSLLTGLFSLLPVVGYLFGELSFPQFFNSTPMAAHAALGFFALAIGILIATSNHGLLARKQHLLMTLALMASLIMLLIASLSVIHSMAQDRAATRLVENFYQVLRASDNIISASYKFQKHIRAYLLMGKDQDVADADATHQEMLDLINELRLLTKDSSDQQDLLNAIEPALVIRFDKAHAFVKEKRERGLQASVNLIAESDIEHINSAIEVQLKRLNVAANQLLSKQEQAASLKESMALASFCFTMAITFIVLFIIVRNLRREIKLREQIIETSLDAIIIFDTNGLITVWNPQAEIIFGWRAEEAIGRSLYSTIIPINERTALKEDFHRYLASGISNIIGKRIELNALRHNGSEFPIELSVDVVMVGGERHFSAFLHDITNRKLAEKCLYDSEEQLRYVLNGSELGFWDWDIVTGKVERNEQWAKILGYSHEELTHTTQQWEEFVHPADREIAWRSINDVLEGRSVTHKLEYRMLHKDGSIRWILDQANVMQRDADGKPTRMSGTHSDISERRLIDSVTQFLAQSSAMVGSQDFFHALAPFLAEALAVDYICIDRLVGSNLSAETLAVFYDGQFEDNLVYQLRDTPCGDVIGKLTCVFPSGVCNLFPHDAALQELGAEGYIGVTLWSETGEPIGLIAAISRKPIENPKMAETILKLVTVRSASELERKQAEENLQLLASVFTHAREGITIADASGIIIDVNDTFSLITGYSREEAIGQNPRILQSGRHSPEFYIDMWKDLDEKYCWQGEIWNRRKNGQVYAEMLTISAVHNAAGEVKNYVGLFTDITLIKEHQHELEHIAHYDALTNLPNRILMADRLSQAMAQCQRRHQSLAVVFLDLDGFKAINDLHGHAVGDELLITVSRRMKEALREQDTLSRIGGDEFVAVLADLVKAEDCQPVLERLLKAAADPVTVGETALNITASLGVTLYPEDGADADQLIRHADQAMYVAKQTGKNRYHLFDTLQDDAVKTQREEIGDIRSALDRGEFVLYYQPKVNMATGEVIGVEALIRWQHPVRGLVPPIEFLPVIEGHAISIELGEWVIDTALAQINQWQSMGLNLSISVNIAAYQLQQANFLSRLSALLAAHPEVAPLHLELEILETSALSDINQVSATMRACRDLGIEFALDDFGTGYSSLTYLRRLPAHLIKIDQSFVRDMLDDLNDLAIVEGVVSLANAFSRKVIAEGIETVGHGEALLKIGCDLAQGYGIARPMPATDIPEWVVHWKPDKSWQTESLIEADQSSILLKSISGTSKNLTWDHRYNLGYPKIDMEHRIFLGLVGNFKEAMTQGLSKDRLISILHEIAKYADFHFASEENVMADCNYPELAQHAGLHRELLKEVNSYYSRFNQDEVEAKEVLEFLFDWFVLHTSTEDKKLAGFLNGVD